MNRSRTYHILASGFFILSPVLIMLLLSLLSGNNMFLAKPYLNDEIDYWRLMYSFRECGINFGSTEHLVGYWAPIGPLGSHGLSPLAAWGWYALLFPWTGSAIVISGVVMLVASLAFFCFLVKPGTRQLFILGLFTLLFPPLVRYIGSSMMEMPCYACLIVFCALLIRYQRQYEGKAPKSPWLFPAILIWGLYCTTLRMSNAVLLFPALLIFCRYRIDLKLFITMALYALGVMLFNKVFSLFVAPFPDVLYTLSQSETVSQMLLGFWDNFTGNIIRFLDPRSDASWPQAIARYFYLLLLLFLAFKVLFKKEEGRLCLSWRWDCFGVFGAGAGCLALVMVLYFVFDWRDYRTLSPFAYFMAVWLIMQWEEESSGFRALLSALLLFGLLMAPDSYKYASEDPRFFPDERSGLDYSQLFTQEPCTLGLYGYDYSLDFAMELPPHVGVCIGIFEENTTGYGMSYILSRPGDPSPSPDYYQHHAEMPGYGQLYIRKGVSQ